MTQPWAPLAAQEEAAHYKSLQMMFPNRARPVGFYPLPTTRIDMPFDPTWVGHTANPGRHTLLYVHVPFCNQRCHYCRFYPGPNSLGVEERFIAGALAQLAWWSSVLGDRATAVSAAFIGGGSPSALSSAGVSELLGAIRRTLGVEPTAEITMEWYPKDSDEHKLDAAIESGVTRFSVGAQSWNPKVLGALGCHHDPGHVDRLLTMLGERGVDNVNVDLMCNVPGQNLDEHLADIQHAATAGAAMISTNILELASGTPYSATGRLEAGSADKRAWLSEICRTLRRLGYVNQRARNFYRDGRLHRYNRLCAGLAFDIVPIGPGAYGYIDGIPVISEPDRTAWHRRAATGAIAGYSRTSDTERRRAFVINCLLELGLDADGYARLFHANPFDDFAILADLRERGVLKEDRSGWTLSQPGVEYADDISVSIYSQAQRELFARHLQTGRSKQESQYLPVPPTPVRATTT